MTRKERREYEAMVQMDDFGHAREAQFPKSTPAGQLFVDLGDAVVALRQYAVSKMAAFGAALNGGGARVKARAALRGRLDAIVRTARMLVDTHPDLANTFRLPERQSDQALLTAARLVARDAKAWEAEFVAHALPETFLADFSSALETFEQELHNRDAGRDKHLAARAGLDAALASGWAAVRKLDVLVANRLHDDPVTMAEWKRARRVVYTTRVRGAATAPADAAPAPATEPAQGVTIVPQSAAAQTT